MKKQHILKHFFNLVTASLACAAILIGSPSSPSLLLNGIGQETEDGAGTGTLPGAENPKGMGNGAENSPQNDDKEVKTEMLD